MNCIVPQVDAGDVVQVGQCPGPSMLTIHKLPWASSQTEVLSPGPQSVYPLCPVIGLLLGQLIELRAEGPACMLVSLWRVAIGSSVLRLLWPGRWERQVLECGGNCSIVQLFNCSIVHLFSCSVIAGVFRHVDKAIGQFGCPR